MKFQEISDKLTQFINRYNYLATDRSANVLFLMKCIVLKYLADNQRIDFEAYQKDIKKNFTLDYILGLWQGTPLRLAFWEQDQVDPQPIGDEIWDWVSDLIAASPSLAGENPGLIGSLYETSLLINHKKNHGIFYTPENIATYMATDVLGAYKIGDGIEEFRVLDPACGSGSLLSAVYDTVISQNGELSPGEKEAQHRQLLETGLLGVDRDPIACLVTRLILTLKGSKYVKPLGVFCGDILTEELVKPQSVDVVIGNPPYVGHKEIQAEYMKLLKNRYAEVYRDKGDLSYCFIYRGWELLKPEGQLIHITSRYFIEAFYGKPLRAFIRKAFAIQEIVDFNGLRVIEGVGVDPAIIRLAKKTRIDDQQTIQVKRFFIKNHKPESYPRLIQSLDQKNQQGDLYESFELLQAQLNDDSWRLYSPVTQGIIEKIENKTPFTLDNVVQSFQGIISGNDKAFIFEQNDPALCAFDPVFLKPWIKNKDVRAYQVTEPQKKILYTNMIGAIDQYPQVAAQLEKHREKLKNRRECKNGKLAWYKLQWGRDPDHFEGRKIVFPYKATQNRFAIDENKCYFSADVYGLILKPRLYHQVNEEFLVILLNSRLYNYYFKSYGKKLGDKLYEYYPNTLLRLGIPDIKDETIKFFKDSYDRIVELKKNGDTTESGKILAEIDKWFYNFFELSQVEIAVIETNQ
ncbi:N-6 DNA methylase [Acetobacterium sp.]|uniref:Eco57I restriction-modification methylase domain-containing protein n=1 Tax=Acetobacterium sp. TaxID=1872094 RepID=UPI0027251408|nr:N-6 DNA methylase [Acetobacterium sp.]MDO9491215.1 N-6 DNA methylase [Acetobacterium sp.]